MTYLTLGIIFSTYAKDYNLNFFGRIADATCNISPDSENQTVNMGSTSASAFSSIGDVGTSVEFTIKLIDCTESITGSKLMFSGEADDKDPSLLAIQDTPDSASGAAIEITDMAGHSLSINELSPYSYDLTPGNNELKFALRYKSTNSKVTPGEANAVMYFDIQYM